MESKGNIIIYQTEDNQTQIEVQLEDNTLWLNIYQMAKIFQTDRTSISRHLKNIYKTWELDEQSTCAKIAQVQIEGNRNVKRDIKYYNLDVILAVGYRVNSLRGTSFRIWANKILNKYLLDGYALNENLLKNQKDRLRKLQDSIRLFSELSKTKYISSDEKDSFLMLLTKYSAALNLLDDYDYNRINKPTGALETAYKLEYDEVKEIIQKMKAELANSEYFGKEKDESLKSSIAAIYQTFEGEDLYPLIFEKAVHLLYFLVKNHSFIDGNKRIAAALFLYFLDKNKILDDSNINNDLLVALTLMIANSKSSDKEIIINIVTIILHKTE